MRARTILQLMILAMVAALLTTEAIHSQEFGKGKGGRPPFGGKGGGFPMMDDPNAMFDKLAAGKDSLEISQTKLLQTSLLQYAQENGIKNGKLTREQFSQFGAWFKAKAASGALPFKGPPGAGGGPPPGPASPDALNLMADTEFKRRDTNGDGKLNQDEMSGKLRDSLAKWDTNGDGLIDQAEFRAYFAARLTGDHDGGPSPGNSAAANIVDEDDWDRRPSVLRAGKLPQKGLPEWFVKYDIDKDGQVALWEWRKMGKVLDEFNNWDTDDDGFITPDEAMKTLAKLAPKAKGQAPGIASLAPSAGDEASRSPFSRRGGGPPGSSGGGPPSRSGPGSGAWGSGGGSPWGGGGSPSGSGGSSKKKSKSDRER